MICFSPYQGSVLIMPENHSFSVSNLNLSRLLIALSAWLESQGFKVQCLDINNGDVLVQALDLKHEMLNSAVSLNLVFRQVGTLLNLQMDVGNWLPISKQNNSGQIELAQTTALMSEKASLSWQKSQLSQRTIGFIQQYVKNAAATLSRVSLFFCSDCGEGISASERFCTHCGGSLF